MNPEIDVVMRLCSKVLKDTQIEAAVRNSYKGATIVSGGAFVGGLLGGPPGIFVGGALGGAVGWWMSEEFQSLPQIIMKMTSQEKEKLYSDIMAVLGYLDLDDLTELISEITVDTPLHKEVFKAIMSFAENNLGIKVQNV